MSSEGIFWDNEDSGKLWAYNLNYFDYLMQSDMTPEIGLTLIRDFTLNLNSRRNGLEPYPTSLRCMNWIKFFNCYNICDRELDDSLYSQYYHLTKNIEYHLLGNHLLENAFSLVFGAFYFHDENYYKLAKKIIIKELKEQVLNDGAHFELSPMYHQIILFRVLDCINMIKNSDWFHKDLLEILEYTASKMLSWLVMITFSDGSIPMVNDSAVDISPKTSELVDYAKRLNIAYNYIPLSDSGYRKIDNKNYELFLDIGNIGPDYIPGHAHSDTFNFLLHIDGKAVISEVGTSTYENNLQRQIERSTVSHNTVVVGEYEQSEVWGAFRVGRRAKILEINESSGNISAVHNGYKKIGILHKREFIFNDKSIRIIDQLNGAKMDGCFNIHFSPKCCIVLEDNYIKFDKGIIHFKGMNKINVNIYQHAVGFNKIKDAQVVSVFFSNKLMTDIEVIN